MNVRILAPALSAALPVGCEENDREIPSDLDLRLPNGVASEDVTETSAVLWARATRAGTVHFDVATDPRFASLVAGGFVRVADPPSPRRSRSSA